MIKIENLESLAKEKLDENFKFRAYLKNHADQEELDAQFKQLHEKYFAMYDCSKCRNCCIKLKGTIPEDDLKRDAEYLKVTVNEFKNKYLSDKPSNHEYDIKNCPCDFFDGKECVLGDCMPEACKAYPHTNKDNRLESMWSIVDNASICPVVYEIIEELKKIYNFH